MATKNYLITASTGIGAATARLAARQGIGVFLVSRTEEHCRALAGEIRASGGRCEWAVADVCSSAQVDRAVQRCVETMGCIDAAFNVAGISGRRFGDGPAHACSDDGWDVTLDTNARGTFFVCRAVLKHMLEQPLAANGLRGTVLNMASVLGFAPEPVSFATHAYAASKAAIIGMSRSMAAYYAPRKIRVNVIAPGLTRTPMAGRAAEDPAIVERMRWKQPLVEGVLDADDVARAALFLLGDESRVITGDVLVADAGWSVSG